MNQDKSNINHDILHYMLHMKYDKVDMYNLISIHYCYIKMYRYTMLYDIN